MVKNKKHKRKNGSLWTECGRCMLKENIVVNTDSLKFRRGLEKCKACYIRNKSGGEFYG